MSTNSKIEWTETTWNYITGCDKISAGCLHCYAEKMSLRLKAMGQEKYKNGFELTLHPNELLLPYTWKKPRTVFVNSMGDSFHESIPLEFTLKAFRVMNECQQHTFQVLTKRADLLKKYSPLLNFTQNIWVGVTAESNNVLERIDYLRNIHASVKFLSIEPMLTPMPNLDLSGINWVIVGGESGPKSRPIKQEWVIDVKNQCIKEKVPFFFKQWGGKNKNKAGSLLEGNTYKEFPNNVLISQ